MSDITPYQKACLAQLEAWVNGYSYHCPTNNECTPDFSCCHPDLFQTDASKRADLLTEYQKRLGLIQ